MARDDKGYWDNYWRENKNKKTGFNAVVGLARKYYFAKAFAKFIARHYDIRGKDICEIGAGSGLTLAYLKKMGASRCVGIDYSPEAINWAKKINPDCDFILGDAFNLANIAGKSFDLVYSLGFLEHYSKEKQRRALAEQRRIARECVFIEVPYDIFYFRWLFAINRKFGRTTTFSDEEMFSKNTFKELGLKGETKLMPSAFFLTIGHFERPAADIVRPFGGQPLPKLQSLSHRDTDAMSAGTAIQHRATSGAERLIYLANVKLPTERAHGVQIMKMCEAFALAGQEVELIVPRRKNKIKINPFDFYGVKKEFKIKKIPCLDLMRFDSCFGKLVFWLQSLTFLLAARVYLAFSRADVIYSREDFSGLLFNNLVLEMHSMPAKIKPWQKKIWRGARAVFVLTSFMKEALAEQTAAPEKIAVAPDGVDLEEFDISLDKSRARQIAGLPLDKKIVLYAGSLYFYGWKGMNVFLEAAKISDPEILYVLVGGTEVEVARIKKEYALANIILTGRRPHKEVAVFLKAADILVLPNKGDNQIAIKYTSPLKLFEYMAAGRPIVASDLPSTREILNENNAVLVAPNSPAEIVQAVLRLLANPDFGDKIAKQALKDVALKYTWKKRAEDIIKFIGNASRL